MSGIHDENMVSVNDFLHIMRNKDDRNSQLLIKLVDSPKYTLSSGRIQHGCRLIHDDTFRLHGYDTCDRHSLLLTARQPVGRLLAVLQHSDLSQAVIHPRPDLICRNSDILRTEPDILLDHRSDDLVVRILENHTRLLADFPYLFLPGGINLVDPHRPLGRHEQRVHMLGQSRFAGTVVSEDRNEITFLNIKGHIIDCPDSFDLAVILSVFHIVKAQLYSFNDSHSRLLIFQIRFLIMVQISSRPSLVSAEKAMTGVPGAVPSSWRIVLRAFST